MAPGTVGDWYEREHPPTSLALKRGTPDVPADGSFHLLRDGAAVASFRREREALVAFRHAIQESGWTPPDNPESRLNVAALAAEEVASRAEEFWHSASKFRRRGGKGRW
jgi:hypothetical protein